MSTKIPKAEFIRQYPKLAAEGMTDEEVGEELGVSRNTIVRYKRNWLNGDGAAMVQHMVQIETANNQLKALEEGKVSAERCIRDTYNNIHRAADTLGKWAELVDNKDITDDYFIMELPDGDIERYFKSQFEKDQYVQKNIVAASRELYQLLEVAKTILKTDQVVQALQVNIDNRSISIDPERLKKAKEIWVED